MSLSFSLLAIAALSISADIAFIPDTSMPLFAAIRLQAQLLAHLSTGGIW